MKNVISLPTQPAPWLLEAATALFDKLNKDSDNTIDTKELQGRLSKKDLEAADPDKDGTLMKDEYLALVEARFKAADPDNDGKLDAKELGQALNCRLGTSVQDAGEAHLLGRGDVRLDVIDEDALRRLQPE